MLTHRLNTAIQSQYESNSNATINWDCIMRVRTNVCFCFHFKRYVPEDKFGLNATETPDALALASCRSLDA